MTQITLSDYVGFIFSEIVRARSVSDAESKRIALLYKDDEILKNFSVPRFKIPEMDLTIPVLVSGARFKNTLAFTAQQQSFNDFMLAKLENAAQTIRIRQTGLDKNYQAVRNNVFTSTPQQPTDVFAKGAVAASAKKATAAKRSVAKATAAATGTTGAGIAVPTTPTSPGPLPLPTGASINTLLQDFYTQLRTNPDPSTPENIVQVQWARLFDRKLTDTGLYTAYSSLYPNGELFTQTAAEVLAYVRNNTVVMKSEIENLLVNPETQTVKDGSNENSVFLVKAKIVEDGVIIKEVTDENGVVQDRIVEFD